MATRKIEAIVIGGSAGALDALYHILPALPAGFPIPVAIVVHMAPGRTSHLAEVLRTHCALDVQEAEDKESLEPGRVYVSAPNYHLLVEREGCFSLSVDPPVHFSRPAIDVLFDSAADAYGAALVGVLLTGANDDGARGLARIHAAGGTTVVQDPDSAQVRVMPEAALLLHKPDQVLRPVAIGAFLARLGVGMTEEPVKFLLVDDNEENLVALEALLRRDGLEILTARSGREALEQCLAHEVALALLDVQMPEMNGFELAELMRGAERTKHVPIIFVTAGAQDPHGVFKGYESGAVDFLFKPIDPHVLRGKAEVFFELFRQRKQLATALRLNELFVGILGHDLRNPLSTILTGARFVEGRVADDRLRRTIQRMTAAGQRMTGMIEQLLDLTRARLGDGLGLARVREPLDVAQLVQRTVEELRGAFPEREIAVETRGDAATTGDAGRLLQLFSNVVGNALHHGTAGTPVTVAVEAGGPEIVVRVRNDGAIPADVLPTLFDPFRGRAGLASSAAGLGLGLYISQQIAVAHGGDVEVESGPAGGTTLTIRLPRLVDAVAQLGSP